eukprot:g7838.t1
MGWPIERAGTACTIGFGLRLVFQQAQMRAGFWVVEWAVILEVATFQCLDPSITIEGIAFDVFGLSETMARQASSTVLAVFTFAVAGAVTIGGIIYDFAGWQGMSAFHAICQLIVLSQLVAQPVVRKSFWEFFKKEMVKDSMRAGPGPEEDVEDKTRSKAVPKDLDFDDLQDLRIPLTLIVICCFCNYACYVIEFSTFAIFFKAYHGWEAATWASLAQTAGDLVAAVMMKLLRSDVEEVENPSFLRRMTMQPYNIVCLLFCWILCNLGMISPLLPVAVAAQVIMGTVFVYIMKMTNDLNLFFSMGDTSLYLTLQVYCKNAEACGGCISRVLVELDSDSLTDPV